MSTIDQWDPTAANNNSVPPDGAPENTTKISDLNNIDREIMAGTRAFAEDAEWLNWGDTLTYSSGTVFTVATDLTARYLVGRRMKITGSGTGTIYGEITVSSYGAPNTTVTLVFDSGSMSNETLTGYLSILSTNNPVPGGIALGGNAALTAVDIDNIKIDGNAITSTNTNGDITITPNGTGSVVLDGLSWPQADGSASQYLGTDGGGNLSFSTVTTISQAVQADIEAETNENTYIPPDLVKHSPGVAKAWGSFTVAAVINSDYNVSSITDNGAADWTVNWDVDFSNTNYSVVAGVLTDGTADRTAQTDNIAVGAIDVKSRAAAGSQTETNITNIYVVAYGDQ